MPPGQDDNPFGAPRGAWGRQPPTTFGLSTPIKRVSRPSNQIRVPAPTAAPRNILTGGLVPQARPTPSPPLPAITPEPVAPAIAPEPVVVPPDPTLVSDSVLARTSTAPSARVGGLPFPPVAGIGVVIAAIVVAGLLLLRHEPPAPAPAPVTTLEIPTAIQPPAPVVAAEPVAEAPSPAPVLRTAKATAAPQPRRIVPATETPAPITPPPLAAPPITVALPPPAPAASVPPPTDPKVPMSTRLPQ